MKNNWQTKKLGEISRVTDGSHNPPSSVLIDGFPMLSSRNVYNDGISFNNIRHISKQDFLQENKRTDVIPGDILLTIVGSIGRCIVVPNEIPKFTLQRSVAVIKQSDLILPKFLRYFLLSPKVQHKLLSKARGVAQQGVYLKDIKGIEVPILPLSEQKRIVEKLENVLAKTKEAKRLRAEALEMTKNLLSAELHKIFEEGKYRGWEEKEINDLCEHPQYGFTASSTREIVGPKILRITDIQGGKVDWEKVPYCICDQVKKYELKTGDLVFVRTGATVGKSYLVKVTPEKVIFASYLIRLRPKESIVPEYLYYFFQSYNYWQQIIEEQVGMAQPNVNGSKLSKLTVPLPPKDEQQKIVVILDSLSEKIKQLQEYQEKTAAELELLEQSILQKAMSGELST